MSDLELFYRLKEKVLLAYRERYPFFQGDWKIFGARDIQNLVDAIEKETRQTISEKWIYTHLKPETNDKLPRRDMLDILSRLVGYTGWDEFVFKAQEQKTEAGKKRSFLWIWVVAGILVTAIIAYGMFFKTEDAVRNTEIPITTKNPIIKTEETETIQNITETQTQPETIVPLKAKENTNEINTKLSENIDIKASFLEPEDYTMILKAFMQSDIKDWETRKEQLDKILSPDLEVIVMLRDNLGAEYFNKPEFAQKLVVPSISVRKMRITDLQTDAQNKVRFIRIKQE